MTPQTTPLPPSDNEPPKKTSTASFQKVLKQTADLFNRTLTEDELRVWKDLPNYCSLQEAENAFRKWQFQGAYFPKPTEILQLVADEREALRRQKRGCSIECERRHGLGYGENDIRWLLGMRLQEPKGTKWDDEKWEQMLAELDRKRQYGAPKWRTPLYAE